MRIVCAESVLACDEAFATLGETTVLPDRAIDRAALRSADALVIRSKTPVTAARIEGTPVRYVGTATAGFDHIDTAALEAAGIRWYAAAGCNAESVADYITAALFTLARRDGRPLRGRRIGVIGVGQVGSRVARNARALGLEVLLNDPPRRLAEGAPELLDLETVLAQSEIVTLHTPLTDSGPFATRGMVGAGWLAALPRGAWFLNASRGEVVGEAALREARDAGQVRRLVLDVWDGEPAIDPGLLARTDLATPHIAGYAHDGKLRGTAMVYADLCRALGRTPAWRPPAADGPLLAVDARGRSDEDALAELVGRAYDIEADDAALRRPATEDRAALAARFERLRRGYPERREFSACRVRLRGGSPALPAAIQALQFVAGGGAA